ncbi:RING-type E3 ubiquitin transferase [Ranunculus cassubicifolius]
MKLQNRRFLDDNNTSDTTRLKEPLLPSSPSSTNTTSMANTPISPVTGFDTSMALTLLVILSALVFMGFFSVYLRRFSDETPHGRRRRNRHETHTSSSSLDSRVSSAVSLYRGVPLSIVKSLPLFGYTGEKVQLDCAVCLSEFEERETVKMIPYCGHIFHPECIDRWFVSRCSCPLCRSTQLLPIQPSTEKMKNECLISVTDERSTSMVAANVETTVESESEVLPRMRRTSSWCSSLEDGERVLLQRSLSF